MKTDYELELEIYEHFNALEEYFKTAEPYALLSYNRTTEFLYALQEKQTEHFTNGDYEKTKIYSEFVSRLSDDAAKAYDNSSCEKTNPEWDL